MRVGSAHNFKVVVEKFIVFLISFTIFINSAHYFLPIELKYLLAATFAMNVVYWILSGEVRLGTVKHAALYLAAFILLLWFGVFFSNAPEYGRQKLTVFATYSLIYISSVDILSKRLFFFIRITILFGVVFIALLIWKFQDPISFLNEMAIQKIRLGIDIEADEEIINPIWLARYMGFIIIVVLVTEAKKLKWKVTKVVLLASLFLYIIASGSKGPLFALVIGVIVLYFDSDSLLRKVKRWTILLIAVTVFFLGVGIQNNEFLQERFLFQGENTSFSSRENIIGQITSNYKGGAILVGSGTGNSAFLLTGHDFRAYPHNIILEVFFENGLLGLFFLVLMIYTAYKCFRYGRYSKTNRFWLALFVYFFSNSLVSGDLISNHTILLSFLCLLTSYSLNKRNIIYRNTSLLANRQDTK